MSITCYEKKEIHVKILYCGAEGAGKTQNLRSIYKRLKSQDLQDDVFIADATSPYGFEFLPVGIGELRGFQIKLHVFTLPSYQSFKLLPAILLKGLDAVVFVADSRVSASYANIEAYEQLLQLFEHYDIDPTSIVKLIQFNKRDYASVVSVPTLRSELNKDRTWIDIEAVATKDEGTFETLTMITDAVIGELAGT